MCVLDKVKPRFVLLADRTLHQAVHKHVGLAPAFGTDDFPTFAALIGVDVVITSFHLANVSSNTSAVVAFAVRTRRVCLELDNRAC